MRHVTTHSSASSVAPLLLTLPLLMSSPQAYSTWQLPNTDLPTSVARYRERYVWHLPQSPHAVATQPSATPHAHIIVNSFADTYRLHAFKYRDWAISRY
jgi:hypothetical protein